MKTLAGLLALLLVAVFSGCGPGAASPARTVAVDAPPVLFPDYTDIVVPPNIAPLHFRIQEKGIAFRVVLRSATGKPLHIVSSDPLIRIPERKWRKLLDRNRGKQLSIDVSVQRPDGIWNHFATVTDTIAEEEIDRYLVYRLINPGYRLWDAMGIYSRDLSNFTEQPVIRNDLAEKNCINCHSFCRNSPDRVLFHIRGRLGGTVIITDGHLRKINTKAAQALSAGVYPAWHPDGNCIAFSVNTIAQEFYSAGPRSICVFDRASDLMVYNVETDSITTTPRIATADLENMPTWSPDGAYLYFCSATRPPEGHAVDSVQYSLLRIAYDAKRNVWGSVDTVLSHKEAGGSISWPRISPDGRFLLFCLSDYGYFTIYNPLSDLRIMDLKTGNRRLLDINSNRVESYHSWSSNGRWFVFSSKRRDGLLARPYFAYFDRCGGVHKAFLLPQKDPSFYDTFLKNYNIPELITAPWRTSWRDLYRVVRREARGVRFDEAAAEDALSGASVKGAPVDTSTIH